MVMRGEAGRIMVALKGAVTGRLFPEQAEWSATPAYEDEETTV